MTTHYYKRFRMEYDLTRGVLPTAELPAGYAWSAWQPGDEDRHAFVKFHSFRDGIDSEVFESLSDYHGCLRLMREIAKQPGFVPAATWLIAASKERGHAALDCGTIQGVLASEQLGGIQNVGVSPLHRGLGLGRALVLKSLAGFREAGAKRVYLEVTAPNAAAVELYRQLGFRAIRTMYRSVACEEVGA
jgi:ribosomal protein S18 acetylase RimI-like enzyme